MIPRFEPTATGGEIISFLGNVLSSPCKNGEETQAFESAFSDYHGGGHAVFVPSGRMALWLILKALAYPAGSEIVVPAFTYFAIPAVIRYAGLVPVYADIDPDTTELTPESVRKVITDKTRAILPTHLFGRTCPMPPLLSLCKEKNVDLLEDCAQSFGANIGDRKAGTCGAASYFTFGITKNFTTFSGGMALCRDETTAQRVRGLVQDFRSASRGKLFKEGCTALAMRMATQRLLFNLSLSPLLHLSSANRPDRVHCAFEETLHGIDDDKMAALRWRPCDAQASAGLRQLTTLDAKNTARRERGTALRSALEQAGCAGLPALPDSDGDHIFMSFAIRRHDRYAFAAQLRKAGVDVSPGYMSDCSSIDLLGGKPGSCPNSESVDREILHIPLYPGLRPHDIDSIANAISRIDKGRARPPDASKEAGEDS